MRYTAKLAHQQPWAPYTGRCRVLPPRFANRTGRQPSKVLAALHVQIVLHLLPHIISSNNSSCKLKHNLSTLRSYYECVLGADQKTCGWSPVKRTASGKVCQPSTYTLALSKADALVTDNVCLCKNGGAYHTSIFLWPIDEDAMSCR